MPLDPPLSSRSFDPFSLSGPSPSCFFYVNLKSISWEYKSFSKRVEIISTLPGLHDVPFHNLFIIPITWRHVTSHDYLMWMLWFDLLNFCRSGVVGNLAEHVMMPMFGLRTSIFSVVWGWSMDTIAQLAVFNRLLVLLLAEMMPTNNCDGYGRISNHSKLKLA